MLAIGWLLIPAVQYMGTVDRTRAQFGEIDEPAPWITWDLTALYLTLLLVTIVFALSSIFGRRREAARQMTSSPQSGEVA